MVSVYAHVNVYYFVHVYLWVIILHDDSNIMSIRPHQIDYMFHGFETQNFDPGGRPKKKKKKS